MKTKILVLGVTVLFQTGCATGMKSITTPDGKRGFIISCDDSLSGWNNCTTAASSVCQGKYRVLDKIENVTPTAYGQIVSRHLVAECKL